jgi:hypothetical protein
MPVSLFTDGLEPKDPDATIWRFMEFWKFRSFIETGTLWFCRADEFAADPSEGLPPDRYLPMPGLNPLDIKDLREIDHHIGSLAQDRQTFFINCWYLGEDDTAQMWDGRGADAVAVRCRYGSLKNALDALSDEAFFGLVRYGSAHLTGWNVLRFITTKRQEYAHEREVRALLWIRDERDGMNRHFDENNIPHDRPLMEPPNPQKGVARPVDVQGLVSQIVLSPWAEDSLLAEVADIVAKRGYVIPIQESALTRYRHLLPYDPRAGTVV